MRTSPTNTEAACECRYGGNRNLGSTPSSLNVIQSLERDFTPAILLGVRLSIGRLSGDERPAMIELHRITRSS
jgi:hypothetical protein